MLLSGKEAACSNRRMEHFFPCPYAANACITAAMALLFILHYDKLGVSNRKRY